MRTKKNTTIRTYSELIKLHTFEDRLEYLKIFGLVGEDTFGFDRYLNQMFYTSKEWRRLRKYIITRDMGCDLGLVGFEIVGEPILIHHMNPITKDDIINKTDFLLNPEFLICTSKLTHKIIHYGDSQALINVKKDPIERSKFDTCPWRH